MKYLTAFACLLSLAGLSVGSAADARTELQFTPMESRELNFARQAAATRDFAAAKRHYSTFSNSLERKLPSKDPDLFKLYINEAVLNSRAGDKAAALASLRSAELNLPDERNKPFSTGEVQEFARIGIDVFSRGTRNLPSSWGDITNFVVDMGKRGQLQVDGWFKSSPQQLENLFAAMSTQHNQWNSADGTQIKHIVICAHGGLVQEYNGLRSAARHRGWWLKNHIYPISLVWRSGFDESTESRWGFSMHIDSGTGQGKPILSDVDSVTLNTDAPSDVWEWVGRRAEFRNIWNEMKTNAEAVSSPLTAPWESINWSQPQTIDTNITGGTLLISRLKKYIADNPQSSVEIHLIGHSAGAILLNKFVARAKEASVPIKSVILLAPAIRVDKFEQEMLPNFDANGPKLYIFSLNDARETRDSCTAHVPVIGNVGYNRSLLYWVSKSFEHPGGNVSETPILGMEKFWDSPLSDGSSLRSRLNSIGAKLITSPNDADDHISDAFKHGGLFDETFTVNSVGRIVTGRKQIDGYYSFARQFDDRELQNNEEHANTLVELVR